jgi:acyl dehydratase
MTDALLHFEDFTPGQKFFGGPYPVSKEEILAFARAFDPQPHHLDEEAGKKSMLGGLSASGWHVCAISMRMFAETMLLKMVNRGGPGCEDCRWIKPVRPNDVLMLEAEVRETKAPSSRPEFGFVKFTWRVFNQRGQVAELVVTTMPARRGV